jgi:hypothetical protein
LAGGSPGDCSTKLKICQQGATGKFKYGKEDNSNNFYSYIAKKMALLRLGRPLTIACHMKILISIF